MRGLQHGDPGTASGSGAERVSKAHTGQTASFLGITDHDPKVTTDGRPRQDGPGSRAHILAGASAWHGGQGPGGTKHRRPRTAPASVTVPQGTRPQPLPSERRCGHVLLHLPSGDPTEAGQPSGAGRLVHRPARGCRPAFPRRTHRRPRPPGQRPSPGDPRRDGWPRAGPAEMQGAGGSALSFPASLSSGRGRGAATWATSPSRGSRFLYSPSKT